MVTFARGIRAIDATRDDADAAGDRPVPGDGAGFLNPNTRPRATAGDDERDVDSTTTTRRVSQDVYRRRIARGAPTARRGQTSDVARRVREVARREAKRAPRARPRVDEARARRGRLTEHSREGRDA